MASQSHPYRDTNPPRTPRPPRRTSVACRRCRGRKVKCAPLEHQPNRTCQRCYDGELDCEYLSVADEERRLSRDPGFFTEYSTTPDGPSESMVQSPDMAQQWSDGGMTSSSTVLSGAAFIPWPTGYDPRSFAEPTGTTAAYGARPYFPQEVYTTPDVYIRDEGPWPQQPLPTQLTPEYGTYDQGAPVGYSSNQDMRPRDRNQGRSSNNNAQDGEAHWQGWYDGT